MGVPPHVLQLLSDAIGAYDFPPVTYDFAAGREEAHATMGGVEDVIGALPRSGDAAKVKDGLSNVLYWGYARVGYRWTRIASFRSEVSGILLTRAATALANLEGPGLRAIGDLALPQCSGVPFISKIRMFLDPTAFVTLDLKLAKGLRGMSNRTILDEVHLSRKPTTIRVTSHNEDCYERWCRACRDVAAGWFPGSGIRAVDVERGVFHLVDRARANAASTVLELAMAEL